VRKSIIFPSLLVFSIHLQAATTNVVTKTETKSAAAAVNDPLQKEYSALLEEDDAAHAEIDKWILEAEEFEKKGAGTPSTTLRGRINQRLNSVQSNYEDFIKRNPGHPQIRLAYGSFLNGRGEELEAVKQWDKARELDPKNPAAWNNLANYYSHRSPIKLAFEYYDKAIELDPTESVYYHNLAVNVYLFRKEAIEYYKITEPQVFDKSLHLYREALKRDPENFILATDYAQTFYGTKPPRYKEGLAVWEDTLKLARDEMERQGVYIHLARMQINLGQFGSARTNLAKVSDEKFSIVRLALERKLTNQVEKATQLEVPDKTNSSRAKKSSAPAQ